MNEEKVFVAVTARIDEDGVLRPKVIEFEEGTYEIDKVLDVCRAACQSVGGVGIRYTCRIRGKETYLWNEKGRWFVVKKHQRPA